MIKLKSIKAKLMTIFILLIIVSLLTVGGVSIFITNTNMKATIGEQATEMVDMTSEVIELQIESVENYIVGLSTNGDLLEFINNQDNNEERSIVHKFLVNNKNQKSDAIESLLLLDDTGIARITNQNINETLDLRSRAYVQEAMSGSVGMSGVIESKMTGNLIMALAVPIRDQSNEIKGILVATIDFSTITKHVEELKLGDEGYAFMIDETGLLVSHPVKDKVLKENLSETKVAELKSVIDDMIAMETGMGAYTYEGVTKMVAFTPVGNFSMAITSAESDYLSTVREIVKVMIIIDAIVIVIAGLITAFVSNMISKNVTKLKDAAEQLAHGNTDVDIEINTKDEFEALADSFKKVIVNMDNLVKESEIMTQDSIYGHLTKRGDETKFEGKYKDIIAGINDIMDTLVGHLDNIGNPIVVVDTEYNVLYANKAAQTVAKKSQKELIAGKCHDSLCSSVCNTVDCPGKDTIATNTGSTIEASVGDSEIILNTVPVKNREGKVVAVLETIFDQTAVKKAQRESEEQAKAIEAQMQISIKQAEFQQLEVTKVISNLDELAKGNLKIVIEASESDEDTLEIAKNFEKINNSLVGSTTVMGSYIDEISNVLSEMANKNLNVKIEREYIGDFVQLKESINFIAKQFHIVLSEINSSAEQVGAGSSQVATSSQMLSQGASEQASSVEQISATVTEVGQQTTENAENAKQANEITTRAKDNAEVGNVKMSSMLSAMDEIKESSRSIANIIKVIDEIAFQTNILALNAAVEAARAGDHGRGFAVVAEEVRNLAARSAKAAKETTEMIDNSIEKVEEGSIMANDTAEAFEKIVTDVTDAGEMVGLIAEASGQQAMAITQIEEGVNQIAQVTQSNSATAEESAAASEQMAGQADVLKEMIQEFSL